MLKVRLLVGVFVCTAAALPASARAQAPSGSQTPPVPVVKEQIEVVATRLPEAPHDVPAPIEVFDGDTLRAMGATNLRDALSLAAGLEVAPGGDSGPASAVPEFWGLREFDAFLLVVDGVPWGGAFNPAIATLSLQDVDRLEVLRGAAPVTYGATSFVGVIHVVHAQAATDRRYLSVHGGNYTSGGLGVDVGLPSMGTWKARLSVDVDREGFRDARTSFSRAHANYRAARYGADRTTWASVDLTLLGQRPASPTPRAGPSLSTATPLDANYNPANAFLDDNRLTASFGFDRPSAHESRWSFTGSYSHTGQSQFRGFLSDVSDAPMNAVGFKENIDINDVYADSHLTWPAGRNVKAVVGGDFLFGNGEGKGATFTYTAPLAATAAPVAAEPTVLNLDSESRRQFAGAYGLVEWSATQRVHFSGGLRLNADHERRGEGEGKMHVRPSGSAGATFGVWERGADHVRLFANYRDTFKPAAFDFSLAENEGLLDPETARSYEGGVKARFNDGRTVVEASGFRLNFNNLVTSTVVGGLPALLNAGVTRFQGWELATEVRPTAVLTARASYSFHDGRFVDFVQAFDDVPTQLAGKRFEMSARHLFSGGVIVSPQTGAFGSVIVKYSGDRYLNKRNTALAPSFVTVDVGAGYRFGRWELRIQGRNLTDRRDPIAESELGDAQYYRLPSRRVDASWGVRF